MGPADFLNFPLEGGGNLQFKQKNTEDRKSVV